MFLFFYPVVLHWYLYGGGAAYYKLTNISLEHLTYHSLFDQWQAYRHNSDILKFLVIGVAVSITITLFPTLMAIVIAIATEKKKRSTAVRSSQPAWTWLTQVCFLTRKPRTRSPASC